MLENQLAYAAHGKGCKKSYQTGVAREVTLRKQEAVKNFHAIAVIKHAE